MYRERGEGKGGKGVEGIYRGPSKGVTFESAGVPQKRSKLTMGGEGVYYQQVRVIKSIRKR